MPKDLDYYLAQARRISEHREAGAEKEIRKLYKSMLKDLQTFMSETYVQYAQEDKLTFAMLQSAGYNARFLEEIEQRLNIATPRAAQKLTELVEETYKAAYESMVDGVAKASGGLDAAFAESIAITPEQVKAAVENPVSGLTLKDTLEKNRREIIYGIKQTVGVGLMNGDRYTTMAKRIAKHVDGDYTKAIRIARTETHRVREAGNHDAAVYVDAELQKGTTGMRMVKTWKTMQDERVRPQRRRKGKKGWSSRMGKGANHMILNEQTVLEDEPFDLKDGNKAMMPGSSGVAGHDINCRCYASRKMMTDEEYFKATGKHFPGWTEAEDVSLFKRAAEMSDSPVEMWMNMSSEEQQAFMSAGFDIKDVYARLHDKTKTVSEWKPANPGGASSFSISADFSGRSIAINKVRSTRGAGWVASADTVGRINVNENGLGADWKSIMAHEAGHQMANMSGELQKIIAQNPGDVLGRYNIKKGYFDGVFGEYNPEEAFATAVSVYYNNPDELLHRYPDTYSAIRGLFKASHGCEELIETAIKGYMEAMT